MFIIVLKKKKKNLQNPNANYNNFSSPRIILIYVAVFFFFTSFHSNRDNFLSYTIRLFIFHRPKIRKKRIINKCCGIFTSLQHKNWKKKKETNPTYVKAVDCTRSICPKLNIKLCKQTVLNIHRDGIVRVCIFVNFSAICIKWSICRFT